MVEASPQSQTQNQPAVPETEIADPEKPTVMVLGTLGHGKSTFMNRIAGRDDCFKAARSIKGVT